MSRDTVLVDDAHLRDLLTQLKTRLEGGDLNVEEISDLIETLAKFLPPGAGASADQTRIFGELDELSHIIRKMKSEIASLRPDDIKSEYIPNATDELDAIVDATAGATHEILDAMDALEAFAATLPPEQAEIVTGATMRVYEACNFQDITGQRTTKVIKALKSIEERVEGLVSAFGDEIARFAEQNPRTKKEAEGEAALLNGPQLEGKGVSQADIDAMFN
ncbi:chemotaxis protein CheZ [Thalassospira sp.]|uniref:chemotaxis protein CheZ n=1 Tax=Thalassospira sp. TaxID=1912094 RepID=UPI0027336E0C|nr:chemotaxis protein CheZ [Thalassospira sp.]MDP2696677.1 chemotaxis protein CheZ [Thalassospira sp.]